MFESNDSNVSASTAKDHISVFEDYANAWNTVNILSKISVTSVLLENPSVVEVEARSW